MALLWVSPAQAQPVVPSTRPANPNGTVFIQQTGTLNSTTNPPSGSPLLSGYPATNITMVLNAGDVIWILCEGTNYGGPPWGNGDMYIALYSPTGTQVAIDDDGGAAYEHDAVYTGYGASLISNYSVTTSGTFTLYVTSWTSAGSQFKVTVIKTTTAPTPTPVGPPTTGIPNVRLESPRTGVPGADLLDGRRFALLGWDNSRIEEAVIDVRHFAALTAA
jgi:hypothetical protein